MTKTCRKGLHQFEGRYCRECRKVWEAANAERIRAKHADWYAANTEKLKAQHEVWRRTNRSSERLKYGGKRFGITPEEYAERTLRPCEICGQPSGKRMHVDHDHATGKLRGTLCHACNTTLGLLKEDPARFLSAVNYIARWKEAHEAK